MNSIDECCKNNDESTLKIFVFVYSWSKILILKSCQRYYVNYVNFPTPFDFEDSNVCVASFWDTLLLLGTFVTRSHSCVHTQDPRFSRHTDRPRYLSIITVERRNTGRKVKGRGQETCRTTRCLRASCVHCSRNAGTTCTYVFRSFPR